MMHCGSVIIRENQHGNQLLFGVFFLQLLDVDKSKKYREASQNHLRFQVAELVSCCNAELILIAFDIGLFFPPR